MHVRLSLLVAVPLILLAGCDPLEITTPWCDPCPDTIYVDTIPGLDKGVDMNDLDRFTKVDNLLTEALIQLAVHNQPRLAVVEATAAEKAVDAVIDARDEVRTLRARFVSGAASLTD